ncbi:MAG TPA: M56 family metallopeptidase [Bacteroidales bacterium]|nr:M56 family metallopeptidase [Bacteroidales bacterium]
MIIYIVKAAIYMIAFYLIYVLLLRKDTAHGRNRAFILVSLIASFILPMVSLPVENAIEIKAFEKIVPDVFVTNGAVKPEGIKPVEPVGSIYSVYIIGVIIFLFKFIADFSSLLYLIIRKKGINNRVIKFQDFNTAGFSALGFIFINSRLTPDEADNVIRHERNHLEKNHYIDIIILEFITAFQWFNPVIHLFNRQLRAIHEFQADRGCIESGISVSSYQSLLFNQIFRSGYLKLTNSFSNPSLIRKRMLMMTRKQTSWLANFKLLSIIPVAGFVFIALSANQLPPPPPPPVPADIQQTEQQENDLPLVVADKMPYFPGGDKALLKYISNHLRYPVEASRKKIQGRVIVRFIVTPRGNISQISVSKSVDPNLDAEAIRVVQDLPPFQPGEEDGKPVSVWYLLPVTFSLK